MMTHKTAIDIPQQIVYIPSNSYHTLHHTLDSCWKMLYSEICCQYSIVSVEYSTAVFVDIDLYRKLYILPIHHVLVYVRQV